MALRAFRGAVQVDHDERDEIHSATAELVAEVLKRNELDNDDLVCIYFTATPDLTADFPAYAARQMGFTDVPLMCSVEMAVPNSMPRVVRLMALANTERARGEVKHVYLRGAQALRRDLAP